MRKDALSLEVAVTEEPTLYGAAFLLLGALLVVLLRFCAVRITMSSMSLFPLTWVLLGFCISAAGALVVWWLGMQVKPAGADLWQWLIFAIATGLTSLVYLIVQITKAPTR